MIENDIGYLCYVTGDKAHLTEDEKENLYHQLMKREEHKDEIDHLIRDVKRSALMLEKIFQNY